MITKTRAAFELTALRLWETNSCKVYFWTFTFYTVHSDWESSELFSAFLRDLRRTIGGDWGGVRVAELHREHGLHFHALINRRLALDVVRRVAKRHAIGRIHVCRADQTAAGYLAKYLSKQKDGPKTKSGRNMRRWASFGNVVKTRVSDLVNNSPMWVYRREHNLRFLGYRFERVLAECWNRGEREFRTAWHLVSGRNPEESRMATICKIANGNLYVGPDGVLVERFRVQVEGPF